MNSHIIQVLPEHEGLRLDKWLALQQFIPSRSRAAELIEKGMVQLSGRPLKASFKVVTGQMISVHLPTPEPTSLQPWNQPLDILFQDRDLAVINKPAGLVVHPAAGHAQDTLVNILLHHMDHLAMGFNEQRPGIVHRLDRDTSGVLVIAKNDQAHAHLAEQFRHKTAHRIYWALVQGQPKQEKGTIRSYLARHPSDRKRFASARTGKHAVTHYRVLQTVNRQFSWVECKLETGRTHQIRVHLSEMGHPILGDRTYGSRFKFSRVALHACELGFTHPTTHALLHFKADWPQELQTLFYDLGFKYV